MNDQNDVRPILSAVSVPTLVVHASHDPIVPIEAGRYIASHIPGARLFEFELAGHVTSRPERMDPWIDEVEEFVTGIRPLGPVGERVLATVLYTDIVGSTQQAELIGDAAWKRLLDQHDKVIEHEVQRFRGVRVKHTGDGALCRFDGPARALSCGLAVATAIRALGLEVRTGVHTGEVELRGDDIGGIALHVGARVMALAQPSEVLATRTVRDLVAGSGLNFDDRGEHVLKGLAEPVHVYAAHA
jgi:class 3 adenylate cyclase